MHYRLAAAALSVLYCCFLHQAAALPPPGFHPGSYPQQLQPTIHPHLANHPIGLNKNEPIPGLNVTGIRPGLRNTTSSDLNTTRIKPDSKNSTSMSSNATGCGSAHPSRPKYIPGRGCTDNDETPAADANRKKFRGKWRPHKKPVVDAEGEGEEEGCGGHRS
jgi:hypothetical protein